MSLSEDMQMPEIEASRRINKSLTRVQLNNWRDVQVKLYQQNGSSSPSP